MSAKRPTIGLMGPKPRDERLTETHMDQDIDLHIGRRLRARRRSLGLSQPQLAEAVGVRFQQIQKYECGEDRISASRLWGLSKALKTPVDHFYEGLEATRCPSLDARERPNELDAQQGALDLVHSYHQLADNPRKLLLSVARSLSREPRSD